MSDSTALSGGVVWGGLSVRERNALVAEHVMGWGRPKPVRGRRRPVAYPFSTDISCAWEVVEAMRERGAYLVLSSLTESWTCEVDKYEERVEPVSWPVRAEAPTAPEAICIAALRACGVEVVT